MKKSPLHLHTQQLIISYILQMLYGKSNDKDKSNL